LSTGLFVGRFQPFHKGHLATVNYALARVETLIIAIGSAQKSFEQRNPFTAGERMAMIRSSLDSSEFDWRRVMIVPVPDIEIHSLWTRYLDLFVPAYDKVFSNDPLTIALFKERGILVEEPPLLERHSLSATEVRRRIATHADWGALVPDGSASIIRKVGGEARVASIANVAERPDHKK